MAEIAAPYDPSDELWQNAIIRWANPANRYIEVTLPEPYLKIPEPEMNYLGLPEKEFYTTGDLCRLLDLHPDRFRYRLRSGIYPEAENRSGNKRRFSYKEVFEFVRITRQGRCHIQGNDDKSPLSVSFIHMKCLFFSTQFIVLIQTFDKDH